MTRGVLLWLLQVLLAGIFAVAGWMKLFVPAEALQMPVAWPPVFFKALGLVELLGALGLIVPRPGCSKTAGTRAPAMRVQRANGSLDRQPKLAGSRISAASFGQ